MAIELVRRRTDDTTLELVITEPSDGDFQIDRPAPELDARRARVMAGDWAVVRQVHSTRVVEADPSAVPEADALVTDRVDLPIAVHGADCAPVAFVTDGGPIGVAHIGWRGLVGGIVEAVVHELGARGADVSELVVGPLIGAECYEFSESDLDDAAAALGPTVRAVTSGGRPALDLAAGIQASAERTGIADVTFASGCTACGGAGFSHRARSEQGRHALVARLRRTPSESG